MPKAIRRLHRRVARVGVATRRLYDALGRAPVVVLLDLRLPDGDGMDVLKTLKGRHPEIAVIIITGYGQVQSAVEAMKTGAAGYLQKPVEHPDKPKPSV